MGECGPSGIFWRKRNRTLKKRKKLKILASGKEKGVEGMK
jgi:hypothetical protein